MNVLVVLGTRPEAIKLAPVVWALRHLPGMNPRVISTGQHREMLQQVLDIFDIVPDHSLDVMRPSQTLPALTGRLLTALDSLLAVESPAAILVQGDTTTAFAASLAAFYRRIPIGHVEAGLRTYDRYSPFPEEINRAMITRLAHWHFAPTERNREALLNEGIVEETVVVTGNTVIDALQHTLATTRPVTSVLSRGAMRRVLVTAHRRENFGSSFDAMCRAIRRIAEAHEDVEVCYPVHLNPNVRGPVERILKGHPRIHLTEPLDYVAFSHLLASAHLVLTDSGGIQEEAPALGKPVLVMRDVTERPEAVDAGVVELVGTDEDRIVERATRLLSDADAYRSMSRSISPYGDGLAGQRIAGFLRLRLLEEQGLADVHAMEYQESAQRRTA